MRLTIMDASLRVIFQGSFFPREIVISIVGREEKLDRSDGWSHTSFFALNARGHNTYKKKRGDLLFLSCRHLWQGQGWSGILKTHVL